ncbi:hypothetical protein E4U24_001407 [Claviceps purpurea]|nr:hypothetical protein E4U11_002019 [Claviceps purpurea]KAG6197778.1 hypothetical protein E4U10_007867 [Claviceps purpurea]KAG6249067.1 hypothetical protein E4U23_002500 [Claviceps purpurea]KAG6251049.1 hypothetical protein E4U24_001407 [Claviceps purpurea]
MNPCANEMIPLSTQDVEDVEASSSATTLEENVGPSSHAGIRFMVPESDKTHRAFQPLPYDMEQALLSLQRPLLDHITSDEALSRDFQFGSHQVWGVHPWYNQVTVSEQDCGTFPQHLDDPSSVLPMNSLSAHLSGLPSAGTESTEVVIERPSEKKLAPCRQVRQDRLPKQFTQGKFGANIKQRELESFVSCFKPLACTRSNVRRCAIGRPSSKARGELASVLGSTRIPGHHDCQKPSDLSVEMLSSSPSSEVSPASAISSPRWSDGTLPLMTKAPSSPNVPTSDTLPLSVSLCSKESSISDASYGLQHLSHLRKTKTCSNIYHQTNFQQSTLLPTEAHRLMEFGAVTSPIQPSNEPTELSRNDSGPSIADQDGTAFETFKSPIAIEPTDPKPLPCPPNLHLLTKDESKPLKSRVSSSRTRGQRRSEPCIPANIRSRQDAQALITSHGPSLRRYISDAENAPISSTSSKPPSNKRASGILQTPVPASSAKIVTEPGSWSQSKRWMSQTSKERMMFQKVITNLFHLSANKSPFVPQSPAELTAFRAEMADIKKRRLSREVGWRIATLESRRARSKGSGEKATRLVPFLLGKQFKDTLSPVFAVPSCFVEHISQEETQWVPWPSMSEFKDEGDKRSLKHGRRLPLPRLGISTLPMGIVSEGGYKAPWQMKSVKIDSRFIYPASDFTGQSDVFSYEPPLTECDVPCYLLESIQAMEEELDD